MNKCQIFLALSLAAISAAPMAASAQEIKPGLYQVTTRDSDSLEENKRVLAQRADLAKLSAADRKKLAEVDAKMEAMMAGMSAADRKKMESLMGETGGTKVLQDRDTTINKDGSISLKVCYTNERIEQRNMVTQHNGCKHTNGALTGGVMKLSYTCTSPASKGEGELRVTGPNAFTSKLTMAPANPGSKKNKVIESTATMLSADCGKVRTL